uniref:SH3 domain-containing protein n=1 Tax=Macrostomum lignano TaxID=282301 RepID=A0A1I8FLZ7_9PLAT
FFPPLPVFHPHDLREGVSFNYSPDEDDLNPCPQRLAFGSAFGDILQVISKGRSHWWQAREWERAGAGTHEPQNGARTAAALLSRRAPKRTRLNCTGLFSFARPGKHRSVPLPKQAVGASPRSEAGDWSPTKEVVHLAISQERPWCCSERARVVGRRHIKEYADPGLARQIRLPHFRQHHPAAHHKNESREEMDARTSLTIEYLEYGTHEDAMYGTKLEHDRDISPARARLPFSTLNRRRCASFRTARICCRFVAFIAALGKLSAMSDVHGLI